MDGHQPSLRSAHPVLHTLPPMMPIRDRDERRMRVRNYRASAKCCPASWQSYFEALADEMEREMN